MTHARNPQANLEASTSLQQQRQAIETEAEQQLRTEQDKLSKLETQLDEAETKIEQSNDGQLPVPR